MALLRRTNKIGCFLICFCCVFYYLLICKNVVIATEYDELNIYAMYLENEEKGDSVLLESKGQYLLMDIGVVSKADSIIKQLQALGVQEVSVYFSHLHKDHNGAGDGNLLEGLERIEAAGIHIKRLYLPHTSVAPLSAGYPAKYVAYEQFMQGKGDVVYLKLNDTFQVGDATGKIVGPVHVSDINPDMYLNKGKDETESENTKYTYYENNLSLAAIITCGNTRYFTAGDCLSDEANDLYNTYGDALKCDIMKLNHHGTGSGNTKLLIDAIKPRYSFGQNTGLADVNPDTMKWRYHMSCYYASQHGLCYFTGSERKTLIIQIKNDEIKLYQGNSIKKDSYLKGWQIFYGADGEFREKDTYYLDRNGNVLTGLQWIGDRLYNFGDSGCMVCAGYDADGFYKGWKKDEIGRRYYEEDFENENLVYILTGFQEIDDNLYYFNSLGYRLDGEKDSLEFIEIEGDDYMVDSQGVIATDTFLKLNDFSYYVDNTGALQKGKIVVDDEFYLARKDGSIITGDREVVKFGQYSYLVYPDGHLRTHARVVIDGETYYFDDLGRMRVKALERLKGQYYYFGKTGEMIKDQKVNVNGKPRYFAKSGSMYCKCYIKYNGKVYECDSDGVMKLVKKFKKSEMKYNCKKVINVDK